MAPSEVEVEPTVPVNETAYARNEEFFLFATIMDATMIDKKLGDKPVYFEISIGNAGNALDGHNESFKVRRLNMIKRSGGKVDLRVLKQSEKYLKNDKGKGETTKNYERIQFIFVENEK